MCVYVRVVYHLIWSATFQKYEFNETLVTIIDSQNKHWLDFIIGTALVDAWALGKYVTRLCGDGLNGFILLWLPKHILWNRFIAKQY